MEYHVYVMAFIGTLILVTAIAYGWDTIKYYWTVCSLQSITRMAELTASQAANAGWEAAGNANEVAEELDIDVPRRPHLQKFTAGFILSVGLIYLLPEGMEMLNKESDSVENHGAIMTICVYCVLASIEIFLAVKEKEQPEAKTADEKDNNDESRHISDKEVQPPPKEKSSLGIAMLLHTIVGGIALGAQEELVGVAGVGLAIIFYFLVAASKYTKKLKKRSKGVRCLMICLFILGTPIGILFGFLVQQMEQKSLEGSLYCSCAGSFIYIACVEILSDGFSGKPQSSKGFGSFFSGLILYASVFLAISLFEYATGFN